MESTTMRACPSSAMGVSGATPCPFPASSSSYVSSSSSSSSGNSNTTTTSSTSAIANTTTTITSTNIPISASATEREPSWLLLKQLIQLAKNMSKTAEATKSHKKFCVTLSRRVKNIMPFLEELRDLKTPLPPLTIASFRALEITFRKAKTLLEECRDGSRMCMVLNSESILIRFHELTAELCRHLYDVPLEVLEISDETREQVELVREQLRRAKSVVDLKESSLISELRSVLETVGKGTALETGRTLELARGLELTSRSSIQTELKALERRAASARALSGGGGGGGASGGGGGELEIEELALMTTLLTRMSVCSSNQEPDTCDVVGSSSSRSAIGLLSQKSLPPVPPDDFRCPISLELMSDPVIISTGQTFDRACILKWMESGHRTCPKTQQSLNHFVLIPNYVLKGLIMAWCEENGVEFPEKRGSQGRGASDGGEATGDRTLVDSLLMKLRHGSTEEQRIATGELRLLAKRSMENRVCIAQAGAIPILVQLLSSTDSKTREHAVTALLNLSINESNKGAIMVAGAVAPIVDVLKSGSMEARENAAATLFSLSAVGENKVAIGAAGAIPALVSLLQEGVTRGKRDAATALFNLTVSPPNKTRAVRAGIIPPLMELLTDRSIGLVDEALAILSVLVTAPEGREAVGQASAVPILVDLIKEGTPRNRENAAAILLALCLNSVEHREVVLKLGAGQPLSALVLFGTPRARRKAQALLNHLQSTAMPAEGHHPPAEDRSGR